jgi:hypothetical protein
VDAHFERVVITETLVLTKRALAPLDRVPFLA